MKPASPEQAVFTEALRCPTPEARAAYLDGACGTDAALRQRVAALLRAAESAGDFLEEPPTGLAAGDGSTLVVTGPSEQPGDRIGRYKLLQQIGEGGCGVVYMAEQEEPVRRRVALKVIKLGMDTKSVIARFEAERQALALMDHPNIAKVFDAGATDTGRPFFVMELVRGTKITDYCDQNNLSTAERLKLFTQVCQAIQHAHQKGIIHRDIKPSNILVTISEPGAPGSPKVIDFGIAKATTGQRLTDKTVFTAFEQFIGTPAYMSPEQAMMTSLDIDTRTDIYALGVLLYELLTGQTPFDAKDLLAAGLDAMRRIIREQEPTRPSTRLSTLLAADLTIVARHRHAEPGRLGALLRGDLDWIVMKALEKDRKRRYETANGLAMDIQRHLDDEAVVARPPSRSYRFQKLVRRNKLTFAAGAAVATALVLGMVVSTWQAMRAETARAAEVQQRKIAEAARAAEAEQRKVAETERSNAERQRALAEANFQKARKAVDDYFTLASESTLLEAPGLQPLRMQLLEAARQYYEGFLQQKSDDPEIQAEMAAIYGRLCMIYQGLDRNDDAVSALLASLRIAEKLVSEHPDNKEYPKRLAGFFKGSKGLHKVTRGPKDPVNALLTLQKIATLWEKLARENPSLPGFRSDLVAMYAITGDLLRGAGQWESARTNLQRALEVAEQLLLEHPTVREYEEHFVYAYTRLAGLFNSSGRRAEGEQVFRRGLQVLVKLAADHPDVPGYRADLGRAYGHLANFLREDVGKQGEAEELYIHAREILEQLAAESPADADNRHALSGCHRGLAFVLRDSNRLPEAEVAYRKAVAVLEPLVLDFPAVPDYRLEFAGTLADLGRLLQPAQPHDAEQAYRQALAVHEKLVADFPTVGRYLLDLLDTRGQLFNLLRNTGQFQEAEKLYRQAVVRGEKLAAVNPSVPDYWRELARNHNQLGILLRNEGRKQEAEVELRKAQELWRQHPDPAIETVKHQAETQSNDVALYRWGELSELYYNAGDWENCLWAIKKKEQTFRPPGGGSSWEWFHEAMAHWQLDHPEEARRWFYQSIAWMDDAQEVRLRGRQAEAAALMGLPDPGERSTKASTYFKQGNAYQQQGEMEKAKAAYGQAMGLYESLVADFPMVLAYQMKLVDLLTKTGRQQEARNVYRETLEQQRKLVGNDHPDVANMLHKLGDVLRDSGQWTEAEAAFREAVAMRRKLFGNENLDLGHSLHGLAWVLNHNGKRDEAEALSREELALRRKLLGNDHLEVAWTLGDLTSFLRDQGKLPEAETSAREALAIRRKRLGTDHPDVANSLNLLSDLLRAEGKLAEVEALYRDELALRRKQFGIQHRSVEHSLAQLARELHQQAKFAEAEVVWREELALEKKLSGDEHLWVANSLVQLAAVLRDSGKLSEAETVYREALGLRRKLLGNEHPAVATSLSWLGATLLDQGKYAEAEAVYRELLALQRKLPADDLQLAAALAGLTRTLLVQQKFADAEPAARECLTIREKKLPDDWLTFNARSMLGNSLLGQEKYAEAEPLLLSGCEGMKQRQDNIPTGSKRYVKDTLQRLLQLYEATGQTDQAAKWKAKLAEFDLTDRGKKAGAPRP